MSTCHTIIIVGEKQIGDEMEIEIMKAGQGYYKEHDDGRIHCKLIPEEQSFSIKKSFEFDSIVQRMSVIAVNNKTGSAYLLCKGNPEKLKSLCKESTIPDNYDEHQKLLSDNGYRVLALAAKNFEAGIDFSSLKRSETEKDMDFLGMIVLENKLKDKTSEVINRLNDAGIQCCMITGDNINTAAAISRHCNIIHTDSRLKRVVIEDGKIEYTPFVDQDITADTGDENNGSRSQHSDNENQVEKAKVKQEKKNSEIYYIIDGETFDTILSFYSSNTRDPTLSDILHKCRVYARTTPEQKRKIVELIKEVKAREEDTLVGYCGDGANDTMALKEADVGVSLSVEEASLAAPFISMDVQITAVERVLIEGRGALNCSFQNLKYFLFYCLTQTIGAMSLYFFMENFSPIGYLWMDLVVAIPLTTLLAEMPSSQRLKKHLPANTLLRWDLILSFIVNLMFHLGCIIGGYWLIRFDVNYRTPEQVIAEARAIDPNADPYFLVYFEPTVFFRFL